MCAAQEWEKMKGSDHRGVIRNRLKAVQNRNLLSVYWCDIWSVRVSDGPKLRISVNINASEKMHRCKKFPEKKSVRFIRLDGGK